LVLFVICDPYPYNGVKDNLVLSKNNFVLCDPIPTEGLRTTCSCLYGVKDKLVLFVICDPYPYNGVKDDLFLFGKRG